MAQTKIKAGLFEGIIGNGTDGYFLMSNGDGTMTWSSIVINPTVTSIAYPGSATAADPAGGETITVTGTGFKHRCYGNYWRNSCSSSILCVSNTNNIYNTC
jgi:hypothetical protein